MYGDARSGYEALEVRELKVYLTSVIPFCSYYSMSTCSFPLPGVCRGFGFVTFVDQAGVDKVLAQTRHELDSKTVSCSHLIPQSFPSHLLEQVMTCVRLVTFSKVPPCLMATSDLVPPP